MSDAYRDIWYMLKDNNTYLYHYTSAKIFIEHIMPTNKLRISKFENVNDPWESKNWSFQWFARRTDISDHPEKLAPGLDHALKANWCVGCFTSDPIAAVMTRAREEEGHDIFSAPFERGHSRPRMWAQYSKNHTGVCLVFSKIELEKVFVDFAILTGRQLFHGHVTYKQFTLRRKLDPRGPFGIDIDYVVTVGIDKFIFDHIGRHWRNIFFEKNTDWAQEHEYRWLIEAKGDDYLFVPIDSALIGVAIGDRCAGADRVAIGKSLLDADVSVCIMDWHMGAPQPKPTMPRLLIEHSQPML